MFRNEIVLLGLSQLTNWGILTTDAELTITGWNPWLELNTGHPANQVVGRKLLEVFPELVERTLDQFYRQALDGKVVVLAQQLHGYLLRMRPSVDGTDLAYMQQTVRLAPLSDEGQVIGTLTLIEDVTERVANDMSMAVQARQQLAIAQLGQSALAGGELADLMDKAAHITADALGVEFAIWLEAPDVDNLQLQTAVGWAAEQGRQATLEYGPGSFAAYALAATEPVVIENWGTESRFSPPSILQEEGIVSVMCVSIMGENRQFGLLTALSKRARTFTDDNLHFVKAIANVLALALERGRLELELRTRVEQLAEADKRKDEFLAMLAHELRNPLAPLRNALHGIRLLDPNPIPEITESRIIMERQVEHLVRLVDDLLDMGRITRGKIQLQKECADLATIVARAIEGSEGLIASRRHTLDVTLPQHPVRVNADPLRLAQVLWNLLNNAAKYTPEGGQIKLTVERRSRPSPNVDEAVIRVRDTGMGIPAHMLTKVFDLFTQMDRTMDRAEGGLGIGLTLVRRLTELHGGSVEVFSEGSGRGSEFVIRLPALPQETPQGAPAITTQVPNHTISPESRRILVVDDNRDAAESLAILLRLFGHDVRTSHDGRVALEVAAAYRPSMVLLDIGLPGMNGLEVCQALRQQAGLNQALIVAMTGYGQEEDRRRSHEAGFDAHLVKPIDLETLYALLTKPDTRISQ